MQSNQLSEEAAFAPDSD